MCFGSSQPSPPAPNVPNYSLSDSEKGVSFEQTKPDGSTVKRPAAATEQTPASVLSGSGLNVKGM